MLKEGGRGKKFSTMLNKLNWLTQASPQCTQPRLGRTKEEVKSPSMSSHEMLRQFTPYCETRALLYNQQI